MVHADTAIGLVVRNSIDYVRRFFDCLERGVPVVPLRSENDTDRIRVCGLRQVIASADEHGWSSALRLPSQDNDALAQIAFTSGTEGEPKGVLLTHGNLADTVQRMLLFMGLDASVREYICVPVYHAFGFGRCRAIAAAGGRFYVPPRGFDLRELAAMIDAGEVNSISSVPTLLRLVLRNRGLFEKNASRVRWMEIGSQAMASDEKRALRELFPQARIVQHYGLTEASRTTLLDVRSANDDELDSVGTPCGAVEIGITNDGRIKTRGPHVARELLVAGQRVPNTDAQGWFVTQDLGECRNGRLYFRGRADDVINLGGLKVLPDTIESEMRTTLGLTGGFCVARVADALRGEAVLVAALDTLAASDEALVGAAGDSLAKAGIDARSAVLLTRVADLPTTDAGKIKRKAVAQRYLDRPAPRHGEAPTVWPGRHHSAVPQTVPSVDPYPLPGRPASLVGDSECLDTEHRARLQSEKHEQRQAALIDGIALPVTSRSSNERVLAALYSEATGRQVTDMSSTLRDVGADSLSIVQIRLDLDTYIGHVPDDWIDMSIRELAGRFSSDDGPYLRRMVAPKSIDAFILCRALAILSVVAHHFHWFVVPGGSTTLLFVIGGYLYYETTGKSISSGGSVSNLWISLVIVVATLVPLAVLQAIVHSLVGSNWHITLLLPYENLSAFIDDRMDRRDTQHHVHWLWFIHVYIQVFAVMALALSFARVRRFFADRTYEKVLGCFLAAQVLGAALILADSTRVDLGHSAALLQYAPTTILPVVLFGVLIALTKTRPQFAATILAGASYAALYAAGVFTQGGITTLVTVALLLFVKTVKVPSALLRPLMMVSDASLFIYLTHMPFQFGILRLLKWDVPPALLTTLAVVASVGLWQVWRSLLVNRIRRLNFFSRVPAAV